MASRRGALASGVAVAESAVGEGGTAVAVGGTGVGLGGGSVGGAAVPQPASRRSRARPRPRAPIRSLRRGRDGALWGIIERSFFLRAWLSAPATSARPVPRFPAPVRDSAMRRTKYPG